MTPATATIAGATACHTQRSARVADARADQGRDAGDEQVNVPVISSAMMRMKRRSTR